MLYKCRTCHEKGVDSQLTKDAPGWLTCKACGRDVEAPNQAPPEPIMNQIAPSHGMVRTDMLAGDAWMPDQPEFPLGDQHNES